MIQNRKYITIATDISNDVENKITTWACYIRYDGGAIKKSGIFKEFYVRTYEAETYALLNALYIARKSIKDWNRSTVIIHNEVEACLTPFRTKSGNIRKFDENRYDKIKNIAIPILEEAESWNRKKIKAHYREWRESDNPEKYAINRWCDREARRVLREARKLV